MKTTRLRYYFFLHLLFALCLTLSGTERACAQPKDFGSVARLDKTVHDFGDIFVGDGPVSCCFTLTNISAGELTIDSVVSSCGCTSVKWTRQTLAPGQSGTIEAAYTNDEGAYPFDKTLSVYLSAIKRPIILHLKGVSRSKKKPLGEIFPVHMGPVGVKKARFDAGTLLQGESRSGEIQIANLGKSAIKPVFSNVSEGLELSSAGSVPAGGTARINYTIRSDKSRWGSNVYGADVEVSGKTAGRIEFEAVTKDNFSSWDQSRKSRGAVPLFDSGTYSFNPVKAGSRFTARFVLSNTGKEKLVIHKMESDSDALTIPDLPPALAPGAKCRLDFTVDTSSLVPGEHTLTVTLYTNAPHRPVVKIFVAGFVK